MTTPTNFAMLPYRLLVIHAPGTRTSHIRLPQFKRLSAGDICYHDNELHVTYFDDNTPHGYVTLGSDGFSTLRQLQRGKRLISDGRELLQEKTDRFFGTPIRKTPSATRYFIEDKDIIRSKGTLSTIDFNNGNITREPTGNMLYIDDEVRAYLVHKIIGDPHWIDVGTQRRRESIEFCEPVRLPEHARYLRNASVERETDLGTLFTGRHNGITRIGSEIPETLGDVIRRIAEEQREEDMRGGLR